MTTLLLLLALAFAPWLQPAACTRAAEMQLYWNRDHIRPDGRSWGTVITDDSGSYPGGTYQEIAAGGYSTLKGAISGWLASPAHAAVLQMTADAVGVCLHDNVWIVIRYTQPQP